MKTKLFSFRSNKNRQIIDFSQKCRINNAEQIIRILYKNPDNPLLLWVDGGALDFCRQDIGKFLKLYTEIFVVVHWQPQFRSIKSISEVIESLYKISLTLKKQFSVEKMYLSGHSFGTVFTLPAAQIYPQLYYSYLAIAQNINIFKNYQGYYQEILKKCERKNSLSAYLQKKIGKITLVNVQLYDRFIRLSSLLKEACPGKNCTICISSLKNIYKQLRFNKKLFEEILQTDFNKTIQKLEIPVYFLNGRNDILCNPIHTYAFFNQLHAPQKTFLWFESSGHFPFKQESKKFETILEKIASGNLDKL